MFQRRARGLLDFLVAVLCLWAAAYHTPVGAALRRSAGWLLGKKTGAQPLLAYYSGGVYDAREVTVPVRQPVIPAHAPESDIAPEDALGYGVHATWMQLSDGDRRPGLALARRFEIDAERLGHPLDGPKEASKLVRAAAAQLASEEAAVLALFGGWEPARYAAERARASRASPTLDELLRQLPPGFVEERQVLHASEAMTLGGAYGLSWPVPLETPVTSPFGYREHPVLGGKRLHTGVDLGLAMGSSVRVVADGVVRRASEDGVNGRVLVIDHGRGVSTAYCHNSTLLVATGERVGRGDVIALSGNTGRSTGPHLHYQLELGSAPVDPFLFRGSRLVNGATLTARAMGERRVDLAGRGFPPKAKVTLEVAGCEDTAVSDVSGAFTLSVVAKAGCRFSCDAPRTPLVARARFGTGAVVEAKPFACVSGGYGAQQGSVRGPSESLRRAFGTVESMVDAGHGNSSSEAQANAQEP